MNCYDCRHVEAGGDKMKCCRGGMRDLGIEEASTGCKNIDCLPWGEEERFPTQISATNNGSFTTLYALCNDETIWKFSHAGKGRWDRLQGIPQRTEKPDKEK